MVVGGYIFGWQLFRVWVGFGCDCLQFGSELDGVWVRFGGSMCVSVVGGGNFFWSNFGGDRRVWLSVGGWCCVGWLERGTERQRGKGDEKEKRELKLFDNICLYILYYFIESLVKIKIRILGQL